MPFLLNLDLLHIFSFRESWGMANGGGEWRTPHFQRKWKRGHNETSLWQLLFIHSLVVCSDLGDLPNFCSENFQKKKPDK